MGSTKPTYIYCLDEQRNFSEDVRRRFSDPAKYRVISFSSKQELIGSFSREAGHAFCRVVILSVYDEGGQSLLADEIFREISVLDRVAGLVIIFPEANGGEIRKRIGINPDALIPKNNNTILRLDNFIKKLMSERNLEISRKRRNLSIYVLLGFLVLSAVILLIAWLKPSVYF